MTEPYETTLPDLALSAPIRQIGKGFQSPPSDDSTAPQTILFTPIVNGEALSLVTEDNWTASPPEKVAKAIHLIHDMSKRREVPTKIHSGTLGSLRSGLSSVPATAAVADWPKYTWATSSSTTWSASMWINTLEAGHACAKEVTILNMIEWMGASEWYDAELEMAEKAPPPTKRGTPRKRLATIVLDKYLRETRNNTAIVGS